MSSLFTPINRIAPRWRLPASRSLAIAAAICLVALVNLLLAARLPLQRALISLVARDAGVGATIAATAGSWQIAPIRGAFNTPLRVLVKDASGKPLANAAVMFSLPPNGPSATFGGGSLTAVVNSDSLGMAAAPPIVANGSPGGYRAFASVNGSGEAPAYFNLINAPATSAPEPAHRLTRPEARHALQVLVWLLDAGLVLAAILYLTGILAGPAADPRRLFPIAATLALSASLFVILATFARDEYFAPVETLMANPGTLPVYGQRLLMVWFAHAAKFVVPSLSDRRAYLATQLGAILLATYFIGEWSALFAGKRGKLTGQLIFIAMLVPTINYSTFYDIPLIAVYTLCLFLLYTKRYALLVAVAGIGTLNHENTLLLVPVAALILHGTASRRVSLGIPLAMAGAWLAARLAMQRFYPEPSHFELHVWTNVMAIAHPTAELAKSFLTLAFWFVCAALGFRAASPFLRRASILLPELIAVTFVAGRFVEARQFDAFIPVAIALMLSGIERYVEAPVMPEQRFPAKAGAIAPAPPQGS